MCRTHHVSTSIGFAMQGQRQWCTLLTKYLPRYPGHIGTYFAGSVCEGTSNIEETFLELEAGNTHARIPLIPGASP